MFHDFLNYLSHEVKLWSKPAPIEKLDDIYVDEIFGYALRFFESLNIHIQYGEIKKQPNHEDMISHEDFYNFYILLDKKNGTVVIEHRCFEYTHEEMRHQIIISCFGLLSRRGCKEEIKSVITIQ